MKKLLKKCPSCETYTLKKNCPKCEKITISPHPAKFSLDDRYARYRVRDRYLNKNEYMHH
ncbi:MAG: RNA-protein complex protein Nop10 [Candidatus Methylarchaceae archaeon HK02M2]|nr:RNA-protein complex protein Nop10 [Candidatus Methylarchaceae archaeon HK02M2]